MKKKNMYKDPPETKQEGETAEATETATQESGSEGGGGDED